MSIEAFSATSNFNAVPLSRTATIGSDVSDEHELFDSVSILNPYTHIIRTITKPDFYIFTSLLWVRTSAQDPRCKTAADRAPSSNGSHSDRGLLSFHRDRLADTAEALRWRHIRALERSEYGLSILRSSIIMYLRCLPTIPPSRMERRKIKLMVNKLGVVRIDSTVIDCPLVSDESSAGTTFLPKTLDISSRDHLCIQINGEPIPNSSLTQVVLDTRPSNPSLFTTYKTSHRVQYDRARVRAKILGAAPTEKEVLLYNKNGEIMEASLCTVYFYRDGRWITPAAICGGNLGVTRRLALENGLCKQGTIGIAEIIDGEKIWLSNGARGFFVGQIFLDRRPPVPVSESGASP